jgi:uncharacterized protein YndB with AHSA1/START domain
VDVKTIHHVVDIAASAEDVYAQLTTQEGLAGWWSTRVAAPAPAIGSVIAFTFLDGFNPEMEVSAIEPDRTVAWTCVGGHEPWYDNTFRFELEPSNGDRTRLRFWQHYATELDDDEYGTYNYNWGYYLHSLQQLCETGGGTPYRA